MNPGGFCPACGRPEGKRTDHAGCPALLLHDPPRFCARCGRRLDVQILPTSYRATCRSCDGVHPARRRG